MSDVLSDGRLSEPLRASGAHKRPSGPRPEFGLLCLTSLVRMVCVFSDVFGLQNTEIPSTHPFYLIIKQQLLIILPLNLYI